MPHPYQPSIGLALGGGAARGWAHIGVIRELEALGVDVHLVAMEADFVIAVDLATDLLHRSAHPGAEAPPADATRQPSMLDVITTSIDIMQVRISRSRMAGDPPEAIVSFPESQTPHK